MGKFVHKQNILVKPLIHKHFSLRMAVGNSFAIIGPKCEVNGYAKGNFFWHNLNPWHGELVTPGPLPA